MKRIDVAINAVKLAGKIVKEGFDTKETKTQTKRNANDLVTEYDLKSQELIIAEIKKHFPDDEIIGEEEGYDKNVAKTAWVIDPIDGTNPYSRKMETFAIVVGYIVDNQTHLCVVFNPVLDKLYVAEAGSGATCNGKPISIAERPFENQVVSVEAFVKKNRHQFNYHLNDHVYNVISRSCGAHSTTMAASGQSDAFIAKALKIWDRVHYLLLIEAGAKVTNFQGEPYTIDQEEYIACHPKYHKKYIEILSETLEKIKD